MKKMLYVVLPALILSVCAVSSFAQNNIIKTLTPEERARLEEQKQKLDEQIQQVDSLRQQIEAQKNTLESMKKIGPDAQQMKELVDDFMKAQTINAGEKIDLQNILFTNNEEKPETKYYKLKLSREAQYVLLDPKTLKETEEESVSWVWKDFLGKYEYDFNFRLIFPQTEQAHLLIKITPVLSKDNEPTLPVIHIAFNFNEKGDITYGGHVRAIDGHEGFESKLAIKVK